MALRFWVGRRVAARGLRFRVAQPLQAIPTEPRASTAKVGGFAKLSKTGFLSNLSRQKRSIQGPWFFLTRKPQRRATTHMGKAVLDVSMSLDGYITGPNDSREQPLGEGGTRLHEWVSTTTQELMQGGTSATTGAIVTGRRTYDLVDGFGGSHRIAGAPVFVLTHDAPATLCDGECKYRRAVPASGATRRNPASSGAHAPRRRYPLVRPHRHQAYSTGITESDRGDRCHPSSIPRRQVTGGLSGLVRETPRTNPGKPRSRA